MDIDPFEVILGIRESYGSSATEDVDISFAASLAGAFAMDEHY